MPYRTILVYLNNEKHVGQLVDVAAYIADRNEAHLLALYVVPSAVVGSVSGLGGRIAGSGREAFREEGRRIKEAFDKAMVGRTVVADWHMIEPPKDHPGPAEAVMVHARAADLVVTAQADPTWEFSLLLDFPERLALESGRPTLVVPHSGRFTQPGRRVLVAWNGRREAVRAVFDALPILQQAESVRILSVSSPQAATYELPDTEIAAALARHGVKCETARSVSTGIDVGNDLLNRVADFGADLLVMGCYGHSRFREFVMGGASRQIFQHMTVPVLMSH